MDLFEWYTFEESISDETGFTGSQSQGYSKIPDNLIPKHKLESKIFPSQTAQISKPAVQPPNFSFSVSWIIIYFCEAPAPAPEEA